MERSTQRYLRFIIPGVLLAFWAFPFITGKWSLLDALSSLSWGDGGLTAAVGIIGAFVYELTGAQKYFAAQAFRIVNERLAQQLCEVKGVNLTGDERERLRHDSRVLQVFWRLVDSDESLKSKATAAYFNGTLVTAATDLTVISSCAGLIHLVAWFARSNQPVGARWWLAVAVICSVLGVLAAAILIRRHLSIGREQVEFIEVHLAGQLEQHLHNLVQRG